MKIHIIGGGPTGLFISVLCNKLNIDCEIYEKNTYIGGHHYIDEKNETMHAPRLISKLFKNYFNILNYCNVKPKMYNQKWLLNHNINIGAIFEWYYSIFIDYPINYNKLKKTRSINYLSKLDDDLKKYMLHVNTYIAAETNKAPITKLLMVNPTLINQFFKKNQNLRIDNYWINGIEKHLNKNKIKINKKCTVTNLNIKNNKVISFMANEKKINLNKDDQIVMAMDPQGIIKLLENADIKLKNNWGDFNELKKKLLMSTYKSIGITIITENKNLYDNFTWIADKPTYLNLTLYYHKNGYFYASICDLNKKVNKKKIENIEPEKLKKIILKDLNNTYPEIKVKEIKFHNDAWFSNNQWNSSHTACAQDAHVGLFKPKGKISNLQFRNSLTKGRTFIISTVETCSEAAISYINSISEKKIKHVKHSNKRFILFIIGFGLPIIILYILYKLIILIKNFYLEKINN